MTESDAMSKFNLPASDFFFDGSESITPAEKFPDDVAVALFARGGSKGIPGKNLQQVGDESLVARAIRSGLDAGAAAVFVSTDSDEIAAEAERAGGTVPFRRPRELASDDSPEWLSWKHLCEHLEIRFPGRFKYLLALPATAPLRTREDVQGVLSEIQLGRWDVVFTVSESDVHPSFNLLRRGDQGSVEPYDRARVVFRRQDADALFQIIPVAYVARVDYILASESMWRGRVGSFLIPRERAVDVDSPADLAFARFLINRGVKPQ